MELVPLKFKRKTRIVRAYTLHNNVELLRGGRPYFSKLLELIETARHSIHLQVYIFDEDNTGRQVAKALMDAAARGVQVFLLIDGYASKSLSPAFRKELHASGVRFRWFEPILRTNDFYFGRRLHHKILVVDSFYSLVGGINISDKYNDTDDDPAWLDWALYSTGDISVELMKVCSKLWTKSSRKALALINFERLPAVVEQECLVRVRRNDWVQNKTQISGSYLEMFRLATSQITIMSSYFLPGRLFQKHLRQAAKRGVEVRLILAGTSDIRLAKYAERYIYRWMLRNKMKIYEYQPSVLHGKIATYDDRWATIGSYNVNNISAFASIELNLDVQDREFAKDLRLRLDEIIQTDCQAITEDTYRTGYSVFSQFGQWLAYNSVRLLFYLFTFYFRQKG